MVGQKKRENRLGRFYGRLTASFALGFVFIASSS